MAATVFGLVCACLMAAYGVLGVLFYRRSNRRLAWATGIVGLCGVGLIVTSILTSTSH